MDKRWTSVQVNPVLSREGVVHGFNNLKQTDAKGLAVISPALLGQEFFKEAAAIVNAGGPPDLEKLKAVSISPHQLQTNVFGQALERLAQELCCAVDAGMPLRSQ
jgi:hypothetical protein